MKKIILIIMIFFIFSSFASANDLTITIESSSIHNQIENLLNDFKLKGVFFKSFNNNKKLLILNNGKESIFKKNRINTLEIIVCNMYTFKKIGEKFEYKNTTLVTKEENEDFYLCSYKNQEKCKKLKQNF